MLWDAGRHDEATAHWRLSLGAFEAQQGRPNLEESFWTNAPAALEHIGERGLAAALRGEVDSLLRKYVERHNEYRVDALLRPVAKYRLVDFAAEPLAVLEPLSRIDALSAQERLAIVRRMIQLGTNEEWRIAQWRQQEVALLLDLGDAAGARTAFAALKDLRNPVLEIRVYAAAGQLEALFERYRQHPEDAPQMRELRRAAEELANRHDDATADRVLEFAYGRELDRGNFDASNFLGLAQIRLKRGELAPAMDLLRRAQMVSGEPFENLMPAADLLEKYGHEAEAAGFVAQRVRAVPWDARGQAAAGAGPGRAGDGPQRAV